MYQNIIPFSSLNVKFHLLTKVSTDAFYTQKSYLLVIFLKYLFDIKNYPMVLLNKPILIALNVLFYHFFKIISLSNTFIYLCNHSELISG